jgi:chromosome segregation ATPase
MGIHVEVTLTPSPLNPDAVGAKMVVEDAKGYELPHLGKALGQLVNGVSQFLPPGQPGEVITEFANALPPAMRLDPLAGPQCSPGAGATLRMSETGLQSRLDSMERKCGQLTDDLRIVTAARSLLSEQVTELQMAATERSVQGSDDQLTEKAATAAYRERDDLRVARDNLQDVIHKQAVKLTDANIVIADSRIACQQLKDDLRIVTETSDGFQEESVRYSACIETLEAVNATLRASRTSLEDSLTESRDARVQLGKEVQELRAARTSLEAALTEARNASQATVGVLTQELATAQRALASQRGPRS